MMASLRARLRSAISVLTCDVICVLCRIRAKPTALTAMMPMMVSVTSTSGRVKPRSATKRWAPRKGSRPTWPGKADNVRISA